MKWYVVYRYSSTGREAEPPRKYSTKDEATREARDFNRYNQDHTWNAVEAYVVGPDND